MAGGKKKRRGKNHNNTLSPFIRPTESQFYATVIKNTGSCKFKLDVYYYTFKNMSNATVNKQDIIDRDAVRKEDILFNMETKIGSVRGNMMRRNYVNAGDIVLVSERDFEKSKVDIIHVYKMFQHSKIRKCKFAPSELFEISSSNEVDFLGDDSQDSDEEASDHIIDNSSSKQYKDNVSKRNPWSTGNYTDSLGLPDDFGEDVHSSEVPREVDALGNFV